jgi:uncharacterized membrane protein (DUF106 family)
MKAKRQIIGGNMTNEDRHLLVETLAEMRELKGEMKEFKDHVMGRVERLEKKEEQTNRERLSVLSILIALGALLKSVLTDFCR